ncbi:hypothetical protein JAAARDRAFT_487951 [Jaapia argillacea MUCL 33604]|uniref:Terpene synthase n=1 Tax=Jaapia argillacea MUCL 33604 TaxID=933084 RepID=A0A067PPQ3_9AGAM|nr:hypothetical protein JAAARDRAFT_487951 [Jaapia argillacea MUCL 33604]
MGVTVSLPFSIPFFPWSPPASSTSAKETLLRRLKGSRVLIPNLYELLPGWRHGMNERYSSMHHEIDDWFCSWVKDDKERRRVIRADFASLAACLYPDAEPDEYRAMAFYHGWIFIWDDVVDDGHVDGLRAAQYHRETCDAVSWCLGSQPFSGPRPAMDGIMSAFAEISRTIVPHSSEDARRRIHDELHAYINTAMWLQGKRKGEILTVQQHLDQRHTSSGVLPSIALLEYIYRLDLPSSIIAHEATQVIINKTCLIIHLVNDIVSFPKELGDNQVDNLIPLLVYHENLSVQEAVLRACALVQEAHSAFMDAERRLPLTAASDDQLQLLVRGCKDMATGMVHWSYLSARYYGENPVREGYKTFVQL